MNIRITGTKGTFDVTDLVPSVRWSGDYRQAARSLGFSIAASPVDKSIPEVDCPLGADVQLMEDGKALFDGFIVSRGKNTEKSEITLSCFDRGFYLNRNKGYYKFVNTPPEQIAARVAADFGIEVGALAAAGVPVSRIFAGVQLYKIIATAYTLASRMTGKQYHIGFRGAQLFVTEKGPDERTLVIAGKSNLIAADTNESIENMVNAVAIYDAAGNLVRTQEDAAAIAQYGRMQEVLKQTKKDDKASEAQKLLDGGGVKQTITIDCLGNTANTAGGSVVVREPYTGLYGLFYIDSDTHEWKRGQYYNKLTLNYNRIMDEQEAGSLPNASGAGTGQSYSYTNKSGGE